MFRLILDKEGQRRESDSQNIPPATDYTIFLDESKPLPSPHPYPEVKTSNDFPVPRIPLSQAVHFQGLQTSNTLPPSGGTFFHDEDEIIEGVSKLSGLESLKIARRVCTNLSIEVC